jgi:hypothetical protein
MELNPNHPVTMAAHDHWHKIVALLMAHFGVNEIEIPLSEVMALATDDPAKMKAVLLQDTGHSLMLRIVTMAEAEKLAKEAGGLLV